jgi:hypothetical protein
MIITNLNRISIDQFATVLRFKDLEDAIGQTGNTFVIYVNNQNSNEIKKVFNINFQIPSLLVLRVNKPHTMISSNDADKSEVFWF